MDRNQGEHPDDAGSDEEEVKPPPRRKPPSRGVESGAKRSSKKPPTVAGRSADTGLVPAGKTLYFDLDFNIAAALCYFPLAGVASILWLVTEKGDNKYLKFHAVQSLVITVGIIGFNVITGTIIAIVKILPVIGDGFGLMITLLQGLVVFIVYAICFRYAFAIFNGKDGRIPAIADISDQIVESYL